MSTMDHRFIKVKVPNKTQACEFLSNMYKQTGSDKQEVHGPHGSLENQFLETEKPSSSFSLYMHVPTLWFKKRKLHQTCNISFLQ